MKNFLKQHGIWILFAAAIIAVALAAMSFFSNTSAPLTNLAGIVASPFRAAYTSVATWFNDKQAYYKDYTALEEENAALRRQLAEMEADIRQAQDDSQENERLRELLELRKQHESFEFEAAAVVEHRASNWTSSLTLNRGTEHGVAAGNCVVTETGYLVGVVDAVGLNWCTVLTVIDTDTSMGAQVFRTKELGVAAGNFTLMEEGKLRLSYLPTGCQLLGGDLIVTSGLGGFYPSGLVIGAVDEVRVDDSGSTQYAILAPSAQLDALSQVFIIKSFDIVD